MAISQATLSGKLQTEIQNIVGAAVSAGTLQDMCDAIAKAVVDEIQGNAVVTGTVTSGAGAGGAVTGSVS